MHEPTHPAETKVNLLLHWEHQGEVTDAAHDIASDRFAAMVDATPGAVMVSSVVVACSSEEKDRFEYSSERELALEAALRHMGEAPRPAVYLQFEALREALLTQRLDPVQAASLVDELLHYLDERLERWQGRPPVNEATLSEARTSAVQGLLVLREAVLQLATYAASRDAGAMVLAQRLAQQSLHSLEEARFTLLQGRPTDMPETATEASQAEPPGASGTSLPEAH